MGKVIQGRFPHSFPRSRKGRKRLNPIEAGQIWVRINTKECWRVEKVVSKKIQTQNRRSQNPAYIYRQKRVYIQHVKIQRVRRRWKINAAWLERNYSEQYFRRCFEEKEIFRKSYAEAQEIMRRILGKEKNNS